MPKLLWKPQDIANFLTKTIDELYSLYPDKPRNNLRAIKRYYEKKMEAPNHEELHKMLEEAGINLAEVTETTQVGFHVGFIKNSEGEIEYTKPLPSVRIIPAGKEITPETFISQAAPTIIRPTKSKGKVRKERQALIVTDAQIPFHDETALNIVQQIAKDNQPDEIVIVGDFADFPTLSRFNQEQAHRNTLMESLDTMHTVLAQFRANAPNATITLLEGNHELRLRRYIQDKAGELYGIRRANRQEELSVLDLSYLLRLDELEIGWRDGYPNGRYWLNDRLKVIHGHTVKQLGKTVTNLIKNDDTSSITGHIHRFEMAQRTIPTRHAGRLIMAASFGTLSRIDGAVPSYHSSIDGKGNPTLHIEQWQQGAGWVSYQPGDKPFDIQPITIHTFDDYLTRFNGKTYGTEN